MWASFALFGYHLYLVFKKDKPEESPLANDIFLDWARFARYAYEDVKVLLTRPPVNSLLMPRPPLPPGQAYMKTLVLNINGTLVHSEYKVSSIGALSPYLLSVG